MSATTNVKPVHLEYFANGDPRRVSIESLSPSDFAGLYHDFQHLVVHEGDRLVVAGCNGEDLRQVHAQLKQAHPEIAGKEFSFEPGPSTLSFVQKFVDELASKNPTAREL